jgi:hypothetical protein
LSLGGFKGLTGCCLPIKEVPESMGICTGSLGFGFCRSKRTSRLSYSGIKAGVVNAGDELAALYLLPASDRKFEDTAIDGRGNGDDF